MLEEILKNHNPCRLTALLEQLPADFSNAIRTSQDGFAKACGLCPINVFKLDEKFERINSAYSAKNCTLNGEPCSMNEFIFRTWGQEVFDQYDKFTRSY